MLEKPPLSQGEHSENETDDSNEGDYQLLKIRSDTISMRQRIATLQGGRMSIQEVFGANSALAPSASKLRLLPSNPQQQAAQSPHHPTTEPRSLDADVVQGNSIVHITSDARFLMAEQSSGSPKQTTYEDLLLKRQCGWLWKRSGRLGTRGFDKRYFVLDHDLLKYFEKETDSKPCNTVSVTELVSIRETPKVDAKRQFGFELVTTERVYWLYSESKQELSQWMLLIGLLIDNEAHAKDALSGTGASSSSTASQPPMSPGADRPDKRGPVKLREHKVSKTWIEYYMDIRLGTISLYDVSHYYCKTQ